MPETECPISLQCVVNEKGDTEKWNITIPSLGKCSVYHEVSLHPSLEANTTRDAFIQEPIMVVKMYVVMFDPKESVHKYEEKK